MFEKAAVALNTGLMIGCQKVFAVFWIIDVSGFFSRFQLVMTAGYRAVLNRAFAVQFMVTGLTGIVKMAGVGEGNRRPFGLDAFGRCKGQCPKGYGKRVKGIYDRCMGFRVARFTGHGA